MNRHSEYTQQESARDRVRARDSGFSRFDLLGNETIPRMFSSQVEQHPQKLAISTDHRSLTYRQLDELAAAIGRMLVRQVAKDRSPIAVLVTDHTYFAASILGILRTGRFYTPLDPSYPLDRNSSILRESKAKTILTERADRTVANLLALPGQQILYVDELQGESADLPDESLPDALAYVIFTSGSTGRPKGVMQTQRNLVQVAYRYTGCLCLGHRDSVSLLSSCSVTASVPPLLSSLLSGATLHGFSVPKHGLHDLADWLNAKGITVYDSAPSLFRHLMKSVPDDRMFPGLKIVRLSSDTVYTSDLDLFSQHCSADAVLINVYGCSEMPTVAGFYADGNSQLGDGVVPVGYPLDGIEMTILDEHGIAIPVSHAAGRCGSAPSFGEIVLQSRYISPGYWDQTTGSDANPDCIASAGEVRSYRTGDLGAIREDHGLVHAGRRDLQTKISGFRVEISEVEACLRACPGVAEAAVVVHVANHGEHALIAFVVSSATQMDLRSYVREKLPGHMVPSGILFIDQMPCTPNGKIDRAALIALRERASSDKARSSARTPVEETLCEMWRQLFDLQRVGIEDDFFALDGNSLLAMRLLSRVEETYAIELDVSAILQNPTISQLAELIESLLADAPEAASG